MCCCTHFLLLLHAVPLLKQLWGMAWFQIWVFFLLSEIIERSIEHIFCWYWSHIYCDRYRYCFITQPSWEQSSSWFYVFVSKLTKPKTVKTVMIHIWQRPDLKSDLKQGNHLPSEEGYWSCVCVCVCACACCRRKHSFCHLIKIKALRSADSVHVTVSDRFYN